MAEDDIPMFPDIIPNIVKCGVFYVIEEFDVKTEDEFRDLTQKMFDLPERDFYYFQENDGPKNPLMLTKERLGYG